MTGTWSNGPKGGKFLADLRPCRLPPAGWHCTRGGGHDGPCAAVPESVEFYPGGPTVARSFGPHPILWNHDPDAALTPPPGSQVDPSMGLPSMTPDEHDREVLRRLDGAKWVAIHTLDGKVHWLPATPEDQALLDAFRAARNGPRDLPPLEPMPPRPVVGAPRKTWPSLLKRVWAWLTT